MLRMKGDMWIFLLALGFMCVSSNDEQYIEEEEQCFEDFCETYSCETHTLIAPLGSSVLLPCNFSRSTVNSVSWRHCAKSLVNLTLQGHIQFIDPRYGRLKAFPIQGSKGNYSIRIDELKSSDLGCYSCSRGDDCLQVQLVNDKAALKEDMRLLLYTSVGLAAFLLLSVAGYYCIKCISRCDKSTQYNVNNPVGAGTEGASAPPMETGRGPVNEQQRGADNLVYENDDQGPSSQQGDPTRNKGSLPGFLPNVDRTQPTQTASGIFPDLNQCNFERMESQRTKMRFHRELFSRLRQASLSRHYYVNQGEINMQQATSAQTANPRRAGHGKKKAKDNHEYKNPIYNRSTEQLNQH